MAVDYTFGITYPPSVQPSVSGFWQRPTFCKHPTDPDLDQVFVGRSGSSLVRILGRDSATKVFDVIGFELDFAGTNRGIWGLSFCQHPTDPSKDQICITGRDTDATTLTRNVSFLQRNSSTTIFDASSSLVTAVPNAVSTEFSLYVPNLIDRDKDQVVAGSTSSTTTYFIQRNPSTGLFDVDSTIQTITLPLAFGLATFCPHPTDSTKDQIGYSNNSNPDLHLIQRNPSTGLFDSGSSAISARPLGGGAGKNIRAITFSPGVNALDDVLATGQGAAPNGGIGILKRNPATDLFDSTVAAGQANNVQLPFSTFSGSDTRPSSATVLRGVLDNRQNVLAFQCATNFASVIFIRRDDSGNYSADSKTQVLQNAGTRIIYAPYATDRNKDLWFGATQNVLSQGLVNDVDSSLNSVSAINFLSDPIGYLGSEAIYYDDTGKIFVNSVVNGFQFDRFTSLVSLYDYSDYTRQENTQSTYFADVQLNGSAALTGDFTLTLGPGTTLDLSTSTRTTFTEDIALSSTSTVVVGASVNLEAFTFAPGTTVNADDGIGPYTVTVSGDPGIVAGPGVTIAAPELTLTITGIPAGGIFTIWDDDDPDPQDLGTLLQETKPTSGGAILYQGTAGNNVIFQFVPKSGASLGFKEFNVVGVIPATSQTLNLSSSLVPETNI